MRSLFPNILQQFVVKNVDLILLRLCNTLTLSLNFHVNNLHSFPNSQYGCFAAINSPQRCHAYVDTDENEGHSIKIAIMQVGKKHAFKISEFVHSGVAVLSDSECLLAMTWYQDCILRNSSGSLPTLSLNTDSYTSAFDELCMSKFPSISNCGGCRLELLLVSDNLKQSQTEYKMCHICQNIRCVVCQNLRFDCPVICADAKDVYTYIRCVKLHSLHSTTSWKVICTHDPANFVDLKPIDISRVLIS